MDSPIKLPVDTKLRLGRIVDGKPREWDTIGEYARFQTDVGTHVETVDMRMVDGIIVITLDKMQFKSISAGGFSSIVRIEVAP